MLKQYNINFVAVDRPGHGLSDPNPNYTIVGWADDIRQLADHLHVEKFYVEGWSAGGPFALAIAHELPGRVIKGRALLSGFAPYDIPDPFKGTNSRSREWMEAAREGNESHVLVINREISDIVAQYSEVEVGQIWLTVSVGGGIDDKEIALRTDLLELLGKYYHEGFKQGPDGPTQDDLILNRPWGFQLQDIEEPFDIWHGELDNQVPLSHGEYQASILPNSNLIVLRNMAHFYPLIKWEVILAIGGALEKWPNFKNALMVLRTGNKLVMVFVMMCMNFERKKLSGRSSYSG